jgi:putative phage-type endonuclease
MEWLDARRQCIGGSDVAAILGLSRWRSPWDVYMSKMKPIEGVDEPRHMARGRFLERAVAEWYAAEHQARLSFTNPFHLIHGPEPWMAASPDALVNEFAWGLECKTSRSLFGWGEQGSDKVPVEYSLQCHWYMACTGLERWDVAAFFTVHDEFRWYTIRRNQVIHDHIVDACRAWRERYIVGGEVPPIDGSTGASEYLKALFPRDENPSREAVGDEQDLSRKLNETNRKIRELETLRDGMKNALISRIGSDEGLYWPGGRVTYKAQTSRRIDLDSLRADHPEIAEKYTVESASRVLRLNIKE